LEGFVGRLDDRGRPKRAGVRSRTGQNDVGASTDIREGRSSGSQSRPQHVVHGVPEDGTRTVGRHAVGAGQRQLQPSAVVGIDGKEGRRCLTGPVVEFVTFGVFVGITEETSPSDGFGQHVLDVLVDEFVVTGRSGGRARSPSIGGGTGHRISRQIEEKVTIRISTPYTAMVTVRVLIFFVTSTGFKGCTFHVSCFHDMLKEFLYVSKCINNRFPHDIVSTIVMFHKPFGNGQQSIFVSRQGIDQ